MAFLNFPTFSGSQDCKLNDHRVSGTHMHQLVVLFLQFLYGRLWHHRRRILQWNQCRINQRYLQHAQFTDYNTRNI